MAEELDRGGFTPLPLCIGAPQHFGMSRFHFILFGFDGNFFSMPVFCLGREEGWYLKASDSILTATGAICKATGKNQVSTLVRFLPLMLKQPGLHPSFAIALDRGSKAMEVLMYFQWKLFFISEVLIYGTPELRSSSLNNHCFWILLSWIGCHPIKIIFFLIVRLLPLIYLYNSSIIQSDSNADSLFLRGFFKTSESRWK